MKTRAAGISCVGLLAVMTVLSFPPSVLGKEPVPGVSPVFAFGMMGLTAGQTARLNVVNAQDPSQDHPGVACRAQLSFLDEQGNTLTQTTRILDPDQAGFLDLPYEDYEAGLSSVEVDSSMGRIAFRGLVQTLSDEPCRTLSASVDILESASGRTVVQCQPDPCFGSGVCAPSRKFAMVGLAPGQAARLSVVYLSGLGADDRTRNGRVTLGFVDGEGNALAESTQVLESAHAASLDLPAELAGSAGSGAESITGRVLVRPVVRFSSGDPGHTLLASLEVFDTHTGRTALLVLPDPCVNPLQGVNPGLPIRWKLF